jgi:hypothetical protein
MTLPADYQVAEITRQLTLIACRNVIHQAASILKAGRLDNANDYMTMGADEVLCRPDESIATLAEKYAYERHCCCKDLAIASDDLTLMHCIQWLLKDSDEDDDVVSLDEVYAVIGLRPTGPEGRAG